MMRVSVSGLVLALLIGGVAVSTSADDLAGRYKKDGNMCRWDAADDGPNQCQPVLEGRFKRNGNSCTWVTGERGADQCRPASGRFKKDGNACVWNGSDSGPDQCNPRQARQ